MVIFLNIFTSRTQQLICTITHQVFHGEREISCAWITRWRHRPFRFYWERLEVKHSKKCFLCVINIVFLTIILNWAYDSQLTKCTMREGCSADPKGPKMFHRPKPFGKWLIFWKNTPMILIIYRWIELDI